MTKCYDIERSTYVILVWVHEQDHEDQLQPADILGPFTLAEAERVSRTLVCEHERRQITTQVPTWAAPTDAPEWTI